MKPVITGLAALAVIYFVFFRKNALGQSLLPIPRSLQPNGGAPTGTGGATGRSNIKTASDIALTGGCAYATGGTGAPLCAAAAPFATNVLGTIGSKTLSFIGFGGSSLTDRAAAYKRCVASGRTDCKL